LDNNQLLLELIGGPPKTRNVSACLQDGRFFAENETWVVDSCTTCTCKVRPSEAPRGDTALTTVEYGLYFTHGKGRGQWLLIKKIQVHKEG
jgi:hypothetical protein